MVLRTLRRVGARVVAAVLSAALTGAPQLAAGLRAETPHACQCRAHGEGHRCACPVCAEQARRARRGAIGKLPPCHRNLALAELDQEEERERAERGRPAMKPTCGLEDRSGRTPPGDSFIVPPRNSLSPARRPEGLAPTSASDREIPAVPDVPPPIRG